MDRHATLDRWPRHPGILRGRSRSAAVGAVVAVVAGLVIVGGPAGTPRALAADGVEGRSSAVLDLPRSDVAVLETPGPGGTPRLLVVDQLSPSTHAIDLSVLERDGEWRVRTTTRIDLAASKLRPFAAPLLIGLGGDRYAVIASSDEGMGSEIVTVRVTDGSDGTVIQADGQLEVAPVVEAAAAADVDGDGRGDLVITTSKIPDLGPGCPRTTFRVFPAGDLSRPPRTWFIDLGLGPGVVGSFDTKAGDDLAAYGWTPCSTGGSQILPLGLFVLRLDDGATIARVRAADVLEPGWPGPPVRLDIDRDGRHELLSPGPRGLSVIDPWHDWEDIRVAGSDAVALGETVEPSGVAWLEPESGGTDLVGAAEVGRGSDGVITEGLTVTRGWGEGVTARWSIASKAARTEAMRGSRPVAWTGVIDDPSCPVLLVPLVTVTCADDPLEDGPAWVGTRPLVSFPGTPADAGTAPRRLLVAAGMDQFHGAGLPLTPDPWGDGSGGRWRRGPGTTFALAEIGVDQLADRRPIGPVSTPAFVSPGRAVALLAPPGTRLAITTSPLGPDAPPPPATMDAQTALARPPTDASRAALRRVPATTDEDSTLAPLDLGVDAVPMPDGSDARRWSIVALPIDDLGEVGVAFGLDVRLDLVPPALSMAPPFLSVLWPLTASLDGYTEAGAIVRFGDGDPVTAGPDGAFALAATLAPWPQRLRLTATDPSGNVTHADVDVIGGIDYRTLPWTAIIAVVVIAAVALSGLVGARRRTGPVDLVAAAGSSRDGPGPVMEDLPPGKGL